MDDYSKSSDSLFWKSRQRQVTKREFEDWATPEMSGQRMVELVTVWLSATVERIHPDLRADWSIDFERPGWIDLEIPAHAIHELERMTVDLPGIVPGLVKASQSSLLDEETWKAIERAIAIKSAVQSLRGVEPRQAVIILETILYCSLTMAEAHTKPWEPVAESGLRAKTGRSKGGKSGVVFTEEKQAEFEAIWLKWVAEGRPGKKRDFDEEAVERFHISLKSAEAKRLKLEKSLTSTYQGDHI